MVDWAAVTNNYHFQQILTFFAKKKNITYDKNTSCLIHDTGFEKKYMYIEANSAVGFYKHDSIVCVRVVGLYHEVFSWFIYDLIAYSDLTNLPDKDLLFIDRQFDKNFNCLVDISYCHPKKISKKYLYNTEEYALALSVLNGSIIEPLLDKLEEDYEWAYVFYKARGKT